MTPMNGATSLILLGSMSFYVLTPEPDNPLFSLDNVVLTPHVAGFTDEGKRRMGVTAAEDILRVLRGEKPKYPVTA